MDTLEIPDNLLEQASRVPGLGERVARFIKFEITQFELRQKRFRPETLALVARAKAKAAETSAAGFDPNEETDALVLRLDKMTAAKRP
jgi:hypothetical protein